MIAILRACLNNFDMTAIVLRRRPLMNTFPYIYQVVF
nr:MAG TPA_asm: hypothetical protein [Caudoviricetes sp.]